MGPAWSAATAAQAAASAAAINALADASRAWNRAIGSTFVGWAIAQAQAGADFGIAGAIASATAGKAGAAAGSIYSAAVSKAAGDLTRSLNAVQTGFVDAATAASVKATKAIAAAETVERKAVAKADVVLAQDLQSAWGTYAAAERSAVTLNARERATIGADYKKEVAGAELAAVKAVAPARKTSMVATAEANGVYHVKVTGIVADLGILGGEIKVEATKAKATSISAWLGKKAQGLWDTAKDVVGTISKSYDTISMAAHTTLSGMGMFPILGVVPDLADLALTAVEMPFGKSTVTDLGLATFGVAGTLAPGTVDVVAGGAKIAARTARAGVKVADGVGAAGKGLDDLASAGRKLFGSKGTLDAIENGRLGGKLYSSSKLDSLGEYLNRRGFRLRLDGDEVLPPNVAAGFDGVKKELVFRRNATEFEVWHELSHLRQYQRIGPEAYSNLTRIQKEQFVFDLLENSKKRWYGLSELERLEAIDYILRIGGIR